MAPRFRRAVSERLSTPEAVRPPFGVALRAALSPGEIPALIVFTPEEESYVAKSPASVLAITSVGWLLIEDVPSKDPIVTRTNFAQTLWIETTGVLLYGRLDITYISDGSVRRASLLFNTVTIEFYRDAATRILTGMHGNMGTGHRSITIGSNEEKALPFKFVNTLHELLPDGEPARSVTSWPSVIRPAAFWQRVELAPAGMLILTRTTLFVVREERTRRSFWRSSGPHYGQICGFVPLPRLLASDIGMADDPSLLRITLRIGIEGSAVDDLAIELPANHRLQAEVFLRDLAITAEAARASTT